jgi:ATP-dependent RNA helicase RhlE
MSFDRLGLSPELLSAVAREGYTVPTPVQVESIPLVLAGRDLLAGAQTGTGKTAAFVLPMLQRLHSTRRDGHPDRHPARRAVRALILAPTRELALQVEASVRTYGAGRPIRSVAIYGGVGFEPQVRALRAGPEIVVATPGRLLDHVGRRTIDLSAVEILVLDEADRMLDMGFIRDIRRVLALLPNARQNLLFSATFSPEIRSLASGLLHDPATVQVTPRNTASELVEQTVYRVDHGRKRELLVHLVRTGVVYQALVFTRTKHGANRLAQQLVQDGIDATAIHGNKSQSQRVRALADFKANRVAILVATEVAARGLDIDALPHVVNFELPMVPEDYVHRIGRTGRAGVDGQAISLVSIDEERLLDDIERVLGRSLPRQVVAGFEPDPRVRPEPIRRGGHGGARPTGRSSDRSSGGAPRHFGPARRPGASHGTGLRSGQPSRPGQPSAPQRHGQPDMTQRQANRPGQPSRSGQAGRQSQPSTLSQRSGGQGIGQRPGQPSRPPQTGVATRPAGGHQRARRQHRGPWQGTVLPGERLARHAEAAHHPEA